MADKEALATIKRGVEFWNRWRETHPSPFSELMGELTAVRQIDLSDAYFSAMNLAGANLQHIRLAGARLDHANLINAKLANADVWGANLTGANLTRADCSSANFRNANLCGATITNANFTAVDLTDADLSGADLTGSDFRGARLKFANCHNVTTTRTNFAGARLSHTILTSIDLAAAEGLELVEHYGPSSIGVDTIYASGGRIPESFLRDSGVPESLLHFIPSLINSEIGINFYSCFISYSSTDEEFARRLRGRMRDANLRVWFAPEDVAGGKKLHEQIETAIRVYDKLLIVLSEASLRSEWVMTELRKAFYVEKRDRKRKLFPVRLVSFDALREWECLDSASGKDLAEEVRQYFIPNFSNWRDHDQFETAFARLLKDLKNETPPTA